MEIKGKDIVLEERKEIAPNISNFDHSIEKGCEEALREGEGKVYCQHAAYNFCGYVWFENDKFYERVMRYKATVAVFVNDSLKELMHEVNERFGSE